VGALALAALAVSMSWTCRPLAGWPSRRWAVTCWPVPCREASEAASRLGEPSPTSTI